MAPRIVLPFLAALLVVGCGASEEPAGSGEVAQLVVRVDPDGSGSGRAKETRVRCGSARESTVCAEAAGLEPGDLAKADPGAACTDLFGGPETARIVGELHGRPVDARFARNNGCEIARWEKVAPLLKAAG